MRERHPLEISAEEAYLECDAKEERELARVFDETNAKLPDSHDAFLGLGQDRFAAALQTGLLAEDSSSNIFVVDNSGSLTYESMRSAVVSALKETGLEENFLSRLRDWCYVYNFGNPHCPAFLSFAIGEGAAFCRHVATALKDLEESIPNAAAHPDIQSETERFKRENLRLLLKERAQMEKEARTRGFIFRSGIKEDSFPFDVGVFYAISRDGKKLMTDKEYEALSFEKQEAHSHAELELENLYNELLKKIHAREAREDKRLRKIRERAIAREIKRVFKALNSRFEEKSPELAEYLSGLREYTEKHSHIFLSDKTAKEDDDDNGSGNGILTNAMRATDDPFLPWKVNLFGDNSKTQEVPVGAGHLASLEAFAGHLNYLHAFGMSHTDHTRIRAGVAAKANGGVLIIDVRDLFAVTGLWVVIKKYLMHKSISFETLPSLAGVDSPPVSPLPIPMNMKFVLFGDGKLVELLAEYDDEFGSFFKIRAEVLPYVKRTPEQIAAYGAWLRGTAQEKGRQILRKDGAARLIEHAGRLAGHQKYLSTDFDALRTVLVEAGQNAKTEGTEEISAAHVRLALHDSFWRASFIYEFLQRAARENIILLEVSGEKVGQVNGLYAIGAHSNFSFGFSTRLTAVTNAGESGIVNMHRDPALAGKIFRKADHTVQGLLKARLAQDFPLALDVHFSFEQTYDLIDGDSASLAEYLVILSSISGVPIRQSIAITGSLNLLGEVQPIGGVNEKIEGFFDLCSAKSALSGEQGVIIPWHNKTGLMLREDVVEAILRGEFHVWAIPTLEDGIAILTGKAPKEVEGKAKEKLREYHEKSQKHPRPHHKDEE